MCLDLPVQARCAILPVPERLHCAQCGCGPENRVSLSGAGVVRIIAVLLWQEMDQKIQSRRQLCHVTVLQDYRAVEYRKIKRPFPPTTARPRAGAGSHTPRCATWRTPCN